MSIRIETTTTKNFENTSSAQPVQRAPQGLSSGNSSLTVTNQNQGQSFLGWLWSWISWPFTKKTTEAMPVAVGQNLIGKTVEKAINSQINEALCKTLTDINPWRTAIVVQLGDKTVCHHGLVTKQTLAKFKEEAIVKAEQSLSETPDAQKKLIVSSILLEDRGDIKTRAQFCLHAYRNQGEQAEKTSDAKQRGRHHHAILIIDGPSAELVEKEISNACGDDEAAKASLTEFLLQNRALIDEKGTGIFPGASGFNVFGDFPRLLEHPFSFLMQDPRDESTSFFRPFVNKD